MLEVEMRGGTLPPLDRRALEAYLLSIPTFDRRRTLPDGTPTEPVTRSAREGFGIYRDRKCTLCHPGPAYMRRGRFDVGTGEKYTVPTLLGVSETAPYGRKHKKLCLYVPEGCEEETLRLLEENGIDYDGIRGYRVEKQTLRILPYRTLNDEYDDIIT